MRVIIVDDEPIALEILATLLLSYDDIEIVGSYTDPLIALKEVKNKKAGIIFLDIEMGKMNGLEAAEAFINVDDTLEIVFITAYSQYAVDAFEINAIDYLLKPIQKKRLDMTIERLRARKEEHAKKAIKRKGSDCKIRINCLGNLQVYDNLGNQVRWRTRRAKELFAYLWLQNNKPVSKNLIMEEVFSDKNPEEAAAMLHTTVYQLRNSFKKLGFFNSISYSNESYQLIIPNESDLDELKILLNSEDTDKTKIENILETYKGDVLEEEGYHWAISIKQDFKNKVIRRLEEFSEVQLTKKNYSLFLETCFFHLYKLEPFNDNLISKIIQYYGSNDKRQKLKSFFKDYAKNLWEEMNLKPSKNIMKLYKEYIGDFK